MKVEEKALMAGQAAPDFVLPSTGAGPIKLSDLRGQPVILVFYPGDFTSVCTSQLALYNEITDMFDAFDAKMLGISVDDIESHQAFAQSLGLQFPILADDAPRGEVARGFGVYDEQRKQCERALFVIDKDGVIQWSHVSPPGINPGANGILEALEGLK